MSMTKWLAKVMKDMTYEQLANERERLLNLSGVERNRMVRASQVERASILKQEMARRTLAAG